MGDLGFILICGALFILLSVKLISRNHRLEKDDWYYVIIWGAVVVVAAVADRTGLLK